MAQRFPLRYPVPGVLNLDVQEPTLRLISLKFPTLQPGVVALLGTYGTALAEQTLLEVVLHTLRPEDLALPDTLGMQPGGIAVTSEGLTIGFVPKPR